MALNLAELAEQKREQEDFWKDATNPRIVEQFPKYPEPKDWALIQFSFNSGWGIEDSKLAHRCYEVERAKRPNGYISRWSSGRHIYTDQDSGPAGEEITKQVGWHITCSGGYIGFFYEWRDVLWFILFQMRGTITEVLAG